MNNRFLDSARIAYTNAIRDLPYEDHIIELQQFFIEMMDRSKQTKMEEIYIKLDEQLSVIEKGK